jgi:hypothetical protein
MSVLQFPVPKDASAFDPSAVHILGDAFEEAWQSLQTGGSYFRTAAHAEQTREILARCIIELAKLGERDQQRLRDAALGHLAEAIIRKGRD